MKRLLSHCFQLFTSAVVLQGLMASAFTDDRPLNVLFLLTEDQGAQLSYVGTKGLQTPNMDALARRGVYFRNAFVAYPVCSASKAAIYTGLFNHTNRLMGNTANHFKPASELQPADRRGIYQRNQIAAQFPTLIELLHAAGYFTGVSGKLHVAPNEKFPYDMFVAGKGNDPVARFLTRRKRQASPGSCCTTSARRIVPIPTATMNRFVFSPRRSSLPPFCPIRR